MIITGAGRAFCSGDDVRQIMLGEQRPTIDRLRDVRPRSDARGGGDPGVRQAGDRRGQWRGGGLGDGPLAVRGHPHRVERARFGELFIKRGLVADLGGLWRLPRLVGPAKAAELLFTGDVIDAQEALRIGLVSSVVAHDELLPAAREMAAKDRGEPADRDALYEGGAAEGAARAEEMGAYVVVAGYLFTTEDHKEGALSFVERREPVFTGR